MALDRLLRTKRPVPIEELVDEELRPVRATDDQEEVARLFERYDLVSAPVVDESDRLVGVITFDDIVDVIEEEAEEDIKALGGVGREEELSDSVWTIAKGRFPWLLANLLTALLASWVISNFEDAIEKMVALAVLMPIVASMGGNAGTQTMTVAVRALATRELSSANAWRIIRRELLVGVLNGLVVRADHGADRRRLVSTSPISGVVIALAMVTVLAAAALGGILIPLVLDPARRRSGGVVGPVRDHDHRRGRLLRLPRHRHAVVRPANNGEFPGSDWRAARAGRDGSLTLTIYGASSAQYGRGSRWFLVKTTLLP